VYQCQHKVQRQEEKVQVYRKLFMLCALVNVVSFFVDGSMLQGVLSLFFFSIVFSFGLRGNEWARLFIKITVWLHIVVVIMLLFVLIMKGIQYIFIK